MLPVGEKIVFPYITNEAWMVSSYGICLSSKLAFGNHLPKKAVILEDSWKSDSS